MIVDSRELLDSVTRAYTQKIDVDLEDYILALNKFGLEVSLFFWSDILSYEAILRDRKNKNIVISNESESSFITSLAKAFSAWYVVYSNKTFEELISWMYPSDTTI